MTLGSELISTCQFTFEQVLAIDPSAVAEADVPHACVMSYC